ncbi:transcriptional regulator, AraC family [Sphingobium chlorophenolicum L-1]|uniref:Transcriptional regulator, AraC family n=1 Tax=Sphingobium chlorophenolicum L-1 TaxID=690566 RepID=F6F1T7_SPHCR|nr:helix-turn-helix domain-containing protein [Sphingobium chlorophenolicum]AEG51503.1 transcriptional regulator, AraC family [Sphingobium chlorophenolicum L-1]
MTTAVPAFYLYGEPQRAVEAGFVHVESLDDRSRPSEWTIQPHIHRDLNHIILIAEGGGSMRADGNMVSFDAPSLLLVPAGIIHGFTWLRESSGWVTTISGSYLQHLLERDEDLQPLFRNPHAISLPPADFREAGATIQRLARELAWSGPGRRGAIESLLLDLMVQALRRAALSEPSAATGGRQARLVARLRERIEGRFRHREPVAAHALALGVSETALRQACAHVAGMSPAAMVDERALLEARRLLLYSSLSIAEIGYAIGFDDPAYFSRFFTRHLGHPPRAWQAEARGSATRR